jgi:hypothetical protein
MVKRPHSAQVPYWHSFRAQEHNGDPPFKRFSKERRHITSQRLTTFVGLREIIGLLTKKIFCFIKTWVLLQVSPNCGSESSYSWPPL